MTITEKHAQQLKDAEKLAGWSPLSVWFYHDHWVGNLPERGNIPENVEEIPEPSEESVAGFADYRRDTGVNRYTAYCFYPSVGWVKETWSEYDRGDTSERRRFSISPVLA